MVAATAGAWAGDPSLGPIFAEVAQRRREATARPTALE